MTTAVSTKRKVLLLRLSSLGDVVLSTAAIDPFMKAGWDIHFLTKAAFAPVLETDPRIRSVYRFDSSDGERAAREKFFAWYEKEKFDLVLDLHDSLRTRFWRCRLRKQSRVVVARKERLREILILVFRLGRWLGFGRGGRAAKMRDAALKALRDFGVGTQTPLQTKISASDLSSGLAATLPREDFLVLVPGSAWEGKKWPYFESLAESAASLAPVVVLGGKDDVECEAIAARAKKVNPQSISLQGKTSVAESAAVIARARLVVGNDTGMIHVAEALGRPVVVVEGPTSPALGFSVYRPESKIMALDLICRPCSKSGRFCFRFGTRKCLRALPSERVFEAVSTEWRKNASAL
jgi:heptosyltransferase-2